MIIVKRVDDACIVKSESPAAPVSLLTFHISRFDMAIFVSPNSCKAKGLIETLRAKIEEKPVYGE